MIVGYKLIDRRTGEVSKSWGGVWGSCPSIPNPLILPGGDQVCSPALGAHGHFDLVEWEMQAPPEAVKAECQRRIMLLLNVSDFMSCIAKQLNKQARINALHYKIARRVALSADEQEELSGILHMFSDIDDLRRRSNEIEAMSSIPADYTADHYWE